MIVNEAAKAARPTQRLFRRIFPILFTVLAVFGLSSRGLARRPLCLITAQATAPGSLSAAVIDPHNVPVENAQVTAINQQTGATFTTTTDSSGSFSFNALPPGNYGLTISAQGFQTERLNIEVKPGSRSNRGSVKLHVSGTLDVLESDQKANATSSAPQAASASMGCQLAAGDGGIVATCQGNEKKVIQFNLTQFDPKSPDTLVAGPFTYNTFLPRGPGTVRITPLGRPGEANSRIQIDNVSVADAANPEAKTYVRIKIGNPPASETSPGSRTEAEMLDNLIPYIVSIDAMAKLYATQLAPESGGQPSAVFRPFVVIRGLGKDRRTLLGASYSRFADHLEIDYFPGILGAGNVQSEDESLESEPAPQTFQFLMFQTENLIHNAGAPPVKVNIPSETNPAIVSPDGKTYSIDLSFLGSQQSDIKKAVSKEKDFFATGNLSHELKYGTGYRRAEIDCLPRQGTTVFYNPVVPYDPFNGQFVVTPILPLKFTTGPNGVTVEPQGTLYLSTTGSLPPGVSIKLNFDNPPVGPVQLEPVDPANPNATPIPGTRAGNSFEFKPRLDLNLKTSFEFHLFRFRDFGMNASANTGVVRLPTVQVTPAGSGVVLNTAAFISLRWPNEPVPLNKPVGPAVKAHPKVEFSSKSLPEGHTAEQNADGSLSITSNLSGNVYHYYYDDNEVLHVEITKFVGPEPFSITETQPEAKADQPASSGGEPAPKVKDAAKTGKPADTTSYALKHDLTFSLGFRYERPNQVSDFSCQGKLIPKAGVFVRCPRLRELFEGSSLRTGFSMAYDPAFYNILLNRSTSSPIVFFNTNCKEKAAGHVSCDTTLPKGISDPLFLIKPYTWSHALSGDALQHNPFFASATTTDTPTGVQVHIDFTPQASPAPAQSGSATLTDTASNDSVNFMVNGINLNDMVQNQITFQPSGFAYVSADGCLGYSPKGFQPFPCTTNPPVKRDRGLVFQSTYTFDRAHVSDVLPLDVTQIQTGTNPNQFIIQSLPLNSLGTFQVNATPSSDDPNALKIKFEPVDNPSSTFNELLDIQKTDPFAEYFQSGTEVHVYVAIPNLPAPEKQPEKQPETPQPTTIPLATTLSAAQLTFYGSPLVYSFEYPAYLGPETPNSAASTPSISFLEGAPGLNATTGILNFTGTGVYDPQSSILSAPIDPDPQFHALVGIVIENPAPAPAHQQASPSTKPGASLGRPRGEGDGWAPTSSGSLQLAAFHAGGLLEEFPPGTLLRMVSRARREAQPASEMDPQAEGAPAFNVIANGNPSGEAFEFQVFDPTGKLKEIRVPDGLIVQPLQTGAVQPVAARQGEKKSSHKLSAYCVNYQKESPKPNALYRVAPPEIQEQYKPVRAVIRAGRELAAAGKFHPDGDPADYIISVRQYALWTRLENWNEEKFAEVFREKTKQIAEQSNVRWTKELDQALRALVPGRWRDISMVLEEARKIEASPRR